MQLIHTTALPAQAYRIQLPQEEVMLTSKGLNQRLVYSGGIEYEDWEKDQITAFFEYLSDSHLNLPAEISEDEILKFLHAANFKMKDVYQ